MAEISHLLQKKHEKLCLNLGDPLRTISQTPQRNFFLNGNSKCLCRNLFVKCMVWRNIHGNLAVYFLFHENSRPCQRIN